MSVRAFACRAAGSLQVLGYVRADRVAEWPPGTDRVQLRIGNAWLCAWLDRSQTVDVEGLLLRDAVPADEVECPGCSAPAGLSASPQDGPQPVPAAPDAAPDAAIASATVEPPAAATARTDGPQVQAAAITVQGAQMVVVLVRRAVIDDAAEAALMQAAMQARFGAAVVLMGQDDDGTPRWWGEPALLQRLQGLPLERMPWRSYPLPNSRGRQA